MACEKHNPPVEPLLLGDSTWSNTVGPPPTADDLRASLDRTMERLRCPECQEDVWEARRVEAEFNAAVERFHMLRMLDLPGDATPQEIAARFDGLPVLRAPGRPEPRPPYLRYSDLVSDDG